MLNLVFVNGQGNCCSWGMNNLQNRLENELNAEIRSVPYSNFREGGQSGGGNQFDWSSVDTQFLRDGESFINNQLDRNRPLILIGHSYGGDSIFSLLPRINRRIQFVAVIDPVAAGGLRATLSQFTGPDTVDYFFNRWQENEPFPIDFGSNGTISCNARRCDQSQQQFVTYEDGNIHRENCTWRETCRRKNRRVDYQELATDAWIQRIVGDRISEVLASSSTSSPSTPRPRASGAYYTKRIGEHCQWYLNNQRRGDWWSLIQSAAQRDASNTDSEYYRKRIANHCEWYLNNQGRTDWWNLIEAAA